MKKKRLLLLIVICLIVLGSLTFFGEKGILNLLRLRKEMAQIKEKNSQLEGENQRLREEIKRLQSDKRYIEEIARKELGMVKEGEIIYQFEDKKGDRHLFDRERSNNVLNKNKK